MGEAPVGTPGPKRWGSARRAVRAGGRRAGQPFDLLTARRTKEGRRRHPKGGLSSLVRT
jgi:hypothetical protein